MDNSSRAIGALKSEPIVFNPVSEKEKSEVKDIIHANYPHLKQVSDVVLCGEMTSVSKIFKITTTDNKQFILKHLLWRPSDTPEQRKLSRMAHEFVHRLIDLFYKEGMPVPDTIRTKDDSFVVDNDGDFYSLQYFSEGTHPFETKEQLKEAGRLCALMHLKGLDILRKNHTFKDDIPLYVPMEKPFYDSAPVWKATLRNDLNSNKFHFESSHPNCGRAHICEYFRQHTADIDRLVAFVESNLKHENKLPHGLCHNDLHQNNMLYSGNKITAILDFDNVGIAPLAEDLANSLMHFVGNAVLNGVYPDYRTATLDFLDAYDSLRKLSDEERKSLPAFMLKWELLRTLRTMRRHFYENDRLGGLMNKLPLRIFPNALTVEEHYGFLAK